MTSRTINWLALISLLLASLLAPPVKAQEQQPVLPFYVVEGGDSLYGIALKFGVSVDQLVAVNGLSDPNNLPVGAELLIPGLSGISGRLSSTDMPFGETLRSLARGYHLPASDLARLNRLVSPAQLYAGANLIITDALQLSAGQRTSLGTGVSLLEVSAAAGLNAWQAANGNLLPNPLLALPGDVLQFGASVSAESTWGVGAFPAAIQQAAIDPALPVQGKTVVVRLRASGVSQVSGVWLDRSLNFFQQGDEFIAIHGLHALMEPGFYPLTLQGSLADGSTFAFSQLVPVVDGGYLFDPPLIVEPAMVDPLVTEPENEQMAALINPVTAEKLWDGQFQVPVSPVFAGCYPSVFGSRRSFNGSAYDYFHAGLDFCGATGDPIYAPARGRVVFAGPLAVRGNMTILDHGHGIYSVYMHQSEIMVAQGDLVDPGQLIGLVGATGRVTGSHLHWEIWAGGVQVDPLDWLERAYP